MYQRNYIFKQRKSFQIITHSNMTVRSLIELEKRLTCSACKGNSGFHLTDLMAAQQSGPQPDGL